MNTAFDYAICGVRFFSLFKNKFEEFGQIIVANPGSMGIDEAFCNFVPYLNCQLFFFLGKAKKVPTYENDKLVVKEEIVVTANNDHRFGDAGLFALGN